MWTVPSISYWKGDSHYFFQSLSSITALLSLPTLHPLSPPPPRRIQLPRQPSSCKRLSRPPRPPAYGTACDCSEQSGPSPPSSVVLSGVVLIRFLVVLVIVSDFVVSSPNKLGSYLLRLIASGFASTNSFGYESLKGATITCLEFSIKLYKKIWR